MTIKTILAVIGSQDETQFFLDNVLALAANFDAHLIGIHHEPMELAYASEVGFPDADLVRETADIAEKRTREIAAAFASRTEGRPAEWAGPGEAMVGTTVGNLPLVRAADLIVAARGAANRPGAADIDSLLADAGRPVLVLPAQVNTTDFKRIVIGWNGSKQAARAVFDALPFLKRADKVEILVIGAEDPVHETNADVIAATLKRHGVPVQISAETTDGRNVEEVLAAHASSFRADLLVLGAYGHSWLREFLFGSVTSQVLKHSPVATLLSH